LYAISELRNLDTIGDFGVFADIGRVVIDVADAIQEVRDKEAGREHWPSFSDKPAGLPTWQRLELCEKILTSEPYQGDCIVWLRLAPATLPQFDCRGEPFAHPPDLYW
jgi:hypothetical protein